jgi:AraC-like DNA-binding protein
MFVKKTPPGSPAPRAVICHANYARFLADRLHVLNPSVKSRMSLWCKGGRGRVIINGRPFACEHGDYFFLPWNHRVEYFADRASPFHLAGIHIIPDHDFRHAVEYAVPHVPTHPLFNCPWRKDRRLPGLEGVHHRHVAEDSPLYLLSESIVHLFLRGVRNEAQIRLLAQALVLELIRTFGPNEPGRVPPPALRKALAHTDANLARPLSVAELARQAERSTSGITGLFRAYCGTSPVQWVNRRRVERARELLATSGLPVGEIGAAVGIEDPFYFSRLFKKLTGQSPRAYRKEARHF